MKIQLCDNPNCAILRTKTGLAVLPLRVEQPFPPFYCSNIGDFRRYMSREESDNVPFAEIALRTPCEVELPNFWRFLWSWKVSDYTQWKAETCCNGGDYAFHETHNIFGRMNSGKLELLDVVRHSTSAEFTYDEANGSFQSSGIAEARFIDVEGDFTLYTQTGSYDENGCPQDREFSLNQFGQPITWQEAILGNDKEIWRDEKKESLTQMGARLQILKETFDWEPPKRR